MPSRKPIEGLLTWREEIATLAVVAILVWKWPFVAERFSSSGGWSSPGLYAAVFSWSSIQVGFLFAIYTFIVPRTEPIFKSVIGTNAFNKFKSYMLTSTYLTLISALGAFILTVVNPTPTHAAIIRFPLIGWLALTGYTVLRFLKVIRTFRLMERSRRS